MPHTVIARQTAPSSNVFNFASIDFSPYKFCILLLNSLVVDTDNTDICLRVRQATALLNGASDYGFALSSSTSTANTETEVDSANDSVVLNDLTAAFGVGNAAGENYCARVEMMNMNGGKRPSFTYYFAHDLPSNNFIQGSGVGQVLNTTACDGIQIAGNAGLILSGRATLVGFS
jgi:hypothetical protein